MKSIIKIYECYKLNQEEFEKNYEKIINNLLKQSSLLYEGDYDNLYREIIYLNNMFNDTFIEKNDDYANLVFFIFRQQYQIINNKGIQIKLIQNIFGNDLLIKKSYMFLVDTMGDLKPEIYDKNDKERNNEENLVRNFLNIQDNAKLRNYKDLYNFFNSLKSIEFNELLLYFLENQCQSYFKDILKMFGNQYTEKCCEMLLLNTSFKYLTKCFQYLFEHNNDNDNNILKIYAIAYSKIYFYYYVEINYNHFDKCNFNEINRLLMDKNEKNQNLIKMRNIYIFRLYFKKFDNFEQFKTFDFNTKNIPIFKELEDTLKKEEKDNSNADYIFKDSFINISIFDKYKYYVQKINLFILENNKNFNFDFDEINNSFDIFYCCLVNKMISYLYGNNPNLIKEKMKYLLDTTIDKINMSQEGKTLYKYLFDNNLLQNNIIKKISDGPLSQEDFEILLYILRIIFNSQMNGTNCFYNDILKKNTSKFISENYIPGSFPFMNEFIKSYNYLASKFPAKELMGYYICKDCGYVYEIRPCTFPVHEYHCPYGHIIGGRNHILSKKDFRIFNDQQHIKDFCNGRSPDYINSFDAMSLEDFKKNYVDQYLLHKEKGILENFTVEDFDKNTPVRELNNLTYRLLSIILYSYLLGAYILNNLTVDEMRKYLVDNLFPHSLFGIIKKNWAILDSSLKLIGFENINIFLNMKFNEIMKFINNLKSVDTPEKLDQFEKSVDKFITDILNQKDIAKQINDDYKNINNKLLNFNPQSIKEIIQSNYPPTIYSQVSYPDIQYYTVSKILNLDTFINKFNSSEENKKKYALISSLINKDSDLTKNAIQMKNLKSINKLVNLLLSKYSYKISRKEGKEKKLKDEIPDIINTYNEINRIKIDSNDKFIEEYIDPFIKSWNEIKKNSVQYKCRVLRDLEKGQKPYEMTINNNLCDFLVDDGDKEGGMFLAAAYQYLILSQNTFIDNIISKNNIQGILNSYVAQLEQSINIQDASTNEIININQEVFDLLNELISTNSMRNIFMNTKEKINYNNYTDIIYNYDNIEEELGKKILPGLKKFKAEKIKFITYLYEGFRGDNSSILASFTNKYNPRELEESEKMALNDLLEANNNSRFYNEVFSSLQILMNEIIKENYNQSYLIYKIIESKPNYIMLNEKLVDFFRRQFEYYCDTQFNFFSVNSLLEIFNYFEALCWKEMEKNIPIDYMQELPENIQKEVISYFETNKNEKIINKDNFTSAIRKLISRSISGTRQEMEIKNDAELKYYIIREDLWSKKTIETDGFENEIDDIFKSKILVGQATELYKLLDGNTILYDKLYKNKNKEKEKELIYEKNEDDIELAKDLNKLIKEDKINDIQNISTGLRDNKDGNNSSDEENEEESEEDSRIDEL